MRYTVAVMVCLAGTLLQWSLWPWVAPHAFLLLYVNVIVAAWFGGLGPGLLATLLSALLCRVLFLAPHQVTLPTAGIFFRLGAFVVVGIIISVLCGRLYTTSRQLIRLLEAEREARAGAEAARAEREEVLARLNALLACASVGIGFVDTRLRFQQINKALASFNGFPAEQHIGRTLGELRPDYWEVVEPILRQVLEQGTEVANLELDDGAPLEARRYFLVSYYPVKLSGNRIIGIGAVLNEITALRRAEEELRESEERFRTTFNQAPVGFAHVALDGRFLRVNQKLCDILGYTASELGGVTLHDVTLPEDLARDQETAEKLGRGEMQAITEEKRYIRKDGSYIWINLTGSCVRAPGGQPRFFILVVEDIAERRQARGELRRLNSELEQLVDGLRFLSGASASLETSLDLDLTLRRLAELVVSRLGQGCIIDLVDRGCEFRRVETQHRDPAMIPLMQVLRRRPPGPDHPASEVVRTGRPVLLEQIPAELIERVATDEEHREALRQLAMTSAMVVPLETRGVVLGALTITTSEPGRRYTARDLELVVELARRASSAINNAQLYQEAQRAIRARDEFLTVASHELKTPLTSLVLQVDGLTRRGRALGQEPPERLARSIELIRRQSDRLTALVNSLLDVARLEGGTLSLNLEAMDLSAAAREVVEHFGEEARRVGSELRLEAAEPVVGRWDVSRLDQVIANLVANALKYGAGRPVVVRVELRGRDAVLSVRDEGIGIPVEAQQRIFGRFERAVSERQYGGLGLGLFIARQIVEALGGEIQVKSNPGLGSTFEVRLPAGDPEDGAGHPETERETTYG